MVIFFQNLRVICIIYFILNHLFTSCKVIQLNKPSRIIYLKNQIYPILQSLLFFSFSKFSYSQQARVTIQNIAEFLIEIQNYLNILYYKNKQIINNVNSHYSIKYLFFNNFIYEFQLIFDFKRTQAFKGKWKDYINTLRTNLIENRIFYFYLIDYIPQRLLVQIDQYLKNNINSASKLFVKFIINYIFRFIYYNQDPLRQGDLNKHLNLKRINKFQF
ncbi:unnamed protein product (macronuclear) [Paramecium tetraurelia]|uniref:Transmembrane protein n=1 Tax=Paramecium tetraurelia TaxID=5888 RepID=A0D8Q7_PARTE|nr:uncharacterized protein GSPATT00014370001 [Paramecium tetraurelia]CAK79424.1 unnamed protein product [Paramecium tetraurelia]|eukprot:XP_001446821.1 hypothetical protein (macronuclear) [Paramecium tetraurelia strain d4-2]